MEQTQKPLYYVFLLSMLSASLFWLGWVVGGFFLFFAFLPLLEIEVLHRPSLVPNGKWRFWGFTFLTFWIANALLFLWLFSVSVVGALLLTLLNALMMCVPFVLFRLTKNSIDDAYGYFSLVLYWLAFEYVQLHAPWGFSGLVLGNAFANTPNWVQWYEISGVLGGSLWVLMINIFLFLALRSYYPANQRIFSFYAVVVAMIGFISSWVISTRYETSSVRLKVAFIQPVLKEKQALPTLQIPSKTDLLILPDLPSFVAWQDSSKSTPEAVLQVKTNFEKKTAQRQALFTATDSLARIHLQTRLAPQVELNLLPTLFEYPPFARQQTAHTWKAGEHYTTFAIKDSLQVATLLGYEGLFGNTISRFTTQGADLLVFLPQHEWGNSRILSTYYFQYARLRAVEQRKSIIVVANQGISGFITPKGEIIQQSNYQLPEALEQSLAIDAKPTFYAQQGDYFGRLAWFLAVALFLTGVIKKKTGGKTVIKAGLK